MLISDFHYFQHLAYSHYCAYEEHYFDEIPLPPEGADCINLTLSDTEFLKYKLQKAFRDELEVTYPAPKGVDQRTKMFVDLELEMGLNRPNTKRYKNATGSGSLFCLSCYDWENKYSLTNYGKKSSVYYGSIFGSLPYYGPAVKLYKVVTTPETQTLFSPDQSNISKNEWALCPSYAEAYFDFEKTGAVCFHASCIQTEIKLGPVAGLVSKFGLFKVKKNLFFEVEENGSWTVLDLKEQKLHSGNWGGWAYALASYYNLL